MRNAMSNKHFQVLLFLLFYILSPPIQVDGWLRHERLLNLNFDSSHELCFSFDFARLSCECQRVYISHFTYLNHLPTLGTFQVTKIMHIVSISSIIKSPTHVERGRESERVIIIWKSRVKRCC